MVEPNAYDKDAVATMLRRMYDIAVNAKKLEWFKPNLPGMKNVAEEFLESLQRYTQDIPKELQNENFSSLEKTAKRILENAKKEEATK